MSLFPTLSASAASLGFAAFGAAEAGALGPDAASRLNSYLEEGRNADMDYMGRAR